MHQGWIDPLGPGGPSLSDPKFEDPGSQRGPPRPRWLGAASACFLVALGAAVLVTQAHMDGLWVVLAGGGVWLLAAGLHYVWREFWRPPRLEQADASRRPGNGSPPRTAPAVAPSWWRQPMSRRQATAVSLPLGAAGIVYSVADSDLAPAAWTAIAGGGLAVIYLVVAYLTSDRSGRHRRFRPAPDDSRQTWRRYQPPGGARLRRP